jgi:hypothetical protein
VKQASTPTSHLTTILPEAPCPASRLLPLTIQNVASIYTRSSQNVPGIVCHPRFGARYWSFLRASGRFLHHDNACCVITQPPYSPDLVPSDSWLFPALKLGLKGTVSQPWRASNGMRWLNFRRFEQKPSAGASNNGRIDGASVCEGDYASVAACPTITVQYHHSGNFLTAYHVL